MNEIAIQILVRTMTILIINITIINNVNIMVHAGDCGPNFLSKKCTCGESPYDGKTQYVVNCTNANFRNTDVLEFMPEHTQILIFTGNQIPELPWNVFGTINNYSLLTVIDMTNNHIREIRGKSYHHVQNVRRLILNHNNLSISRDDDDVNHHHRRVFSNFINLESLHLTNAFSDIISPSLSEDLHDIFVNSNLTKLQKLHLEQNEISHFTDRQVFCDLPKLRDLHLGDNQLKDINFNVMCLKHLRFLDLQRNRFEYIKNADLLLLDQLQNLPFTERTTSLVIDFSLNPLICNCQLRPFQLWLNQTQVIIRNLNNLLCYRDKLHPQTILSYQTNHNCDDINAEQLLLTQNHNNNGGNKATLMFLLVILSLILICLLAALIYMSRDKLKHIVSPVLDNVSKKVQYTTIKDEECQEVHV